jgi:hypothetical protein
MGGNAVEGAERADPEKYADLKRRVHLAMQKYFPQIKTPIEFPNKPSYGDVDVIYAPYSASIISDVIAVEFGKDSADRAVTNGKTVSFPLDNIQIDLIGESINNFEIAVAYYSYGDLGRAIGAMAHWYGLRWGKHGLSAPINCRDLSRSSLTYPWNLRDCKDIPTDDWQTTVTLSLDCPEVLEFLGLDSSVYGSGFEGGEVQIWDWFAASPYFDIDIFKKSIEYLSDASACERSKMRPTYCRFLKWLSENVPELHYRTELPNAVEYFNKQDTVATMIDSHRRYVERKEKFSGRLLLDLGVKKQHIGKLLLWLKQHYEETMELGSGAVDDSSAVSAATTTTSAGGCVHYEQADMDSWIESSDSDTIREWTVQAINVWAGRAES